MDKIKELRKAAEERLQESKRSFNKLMTKQDTGESQEENAKTEKMSDQQQRGTKRRRVCFMLCVL